MATFDVTDADAIAAGVQAIVERCGRIDILVNNAGVQNRKLFQTYTPEEWRQIVGTHLDGAFLVTRAVVPHMLARRSGRIIMIGSIAGERVRGTITAYAAAKGALAALVRALAVELGPHGITCNGIAPGFFATDFTRTLQEDAAFNRYISERVPLGRWGRPEEARPRGRLSRLAGRGVRQRTYTHHRWGPRRRRLKRRRASPDGCRRPGARSGRRALDLAEEAARRCSFMS